MKNPARRKRSSCHEPVAIYRESAQGWIPRNEKKKHIFSFLNQKNKLANKRPIIPLYYIIITSNVITIYAISLGGPEDMFAAVTYCRQLLKNDRLISLCGSLFYSYSPRLYKILNWRWSSHDFIRICADDMKREKKETDEWAQCVLWYL